MRTFLLTVTSIIAKDPERFGITVVETADADVMRALAYRVEAETERKVLLAEDCDASFDDTGGVFPASLGRPWAGGTDTLHSMIYYDAFGRDFFRKHPLHTPPGEAEQAEVALEACTVYIPGKIDESTFDISRIFGARAAYKERIAAMLQEPVEPTHASFSSWGGGMEPLSRDGDKKTFWITSGDRCVKLDKIVFKILRLASERRLTLEQALTGLNPDLQARLMSYFSQLESSGLVVFHDPGSSWRDKRRRVSADEKAMYRTIRTI